MKKNSIKLVALIAITLVLSACGPENKELSKKSDVKPIEYSTTQATKESTAEYTEKKEAVEDSDKTWELVEKIASQNRAKAAEQLESSLEKETSHVVEINADTVEININTDPKDSSPIKHKSTLYISTYEAVGGVAGMEYIPKGQSSWDFVKDTSFLVYASNELDVRATQTGDDEITLEFTNPVIDCTTSEYIDNEYILERGGVVTIDYPYGTGGIVLTILYK